MKRFLLILTVLSLFVSNGVFLNAAEITTLSYNVTLKQKEGITNNLFWTPHSTYSIDNLNDGDPKTIAQIEYHSASSDDMYKEELLKDSFYIVFDLGAVYDLDSIEINWYPSGGRCYKYIVAGSNDDNSYIEYKNHSDNISVKDPIKDSLSSKTARYLRIEILGNYRPSDGTHSEYFPTSEVTIKGSLSKNQPEPTATPDPESIVKKIDYIPNLRNMDDVENGLSWSAAYPIENINDGDQSNAIQIEYAGWYDEETGILDEPFYIVLDLDAVYDLDEIDIYWFLKGDKYYMYKVSTSIDDIEYTLRIDKSENKARGLIKDEFTEVSARYIRIEVLGNYMPIDAVSNKYYAFNEINVFGKMSAVQPTAKPVTPSPTQVKTATQAASATPNTTDNKTTVSDNTNSVDSIVVVVISFVIVAVIATVIVIIIKKKKVR